METNLAGFLKVFYLFLGCLLFLLGLSNIILPNLPIGTIESPHFFFADLSSAQPFSTF